MFEHTSVKRMLGVAMNLIVLYIGENLFIFVTFMLIMSTIKEEANPKMFFTVLCSMGLR